MNATIRSEATVLREEDFLEGVSFEEAERRRAILRDIRANVAEHGPHQAMPDPRRATQFMPFAALTGFDELMKKVEEDSAAAE